MTKKGRRKIEGKIFARLGASSHLDLRQHWFGILREHLLNLLPALILTVLFTSYQLTIEN